MCSSAVRSPLRAMEECIDYLCPMPNESEDSILDSFQLASQKVVLTWKNARPAVNFIESSSVSLVETIQNIDSIPSLQEEVLKNNAISLNKIAAIVNHLCNVEGQLYRVVPCSAALMPDGSLTFRAEKASEVYQVTVLSFKRVQVYYTPLLED